MQHELNDTAPCGLGDKSAMTGRFANNYFDGIRVRGIHALLFFIIMAAYFFEQFDNWNFGFVAPALSHSWGLKPTDIARAKDIRGWGLNPWEYSTGISARRKAR